MISRRAALVAIAVSVPWLVSCERSRAEGGREILGSGNAVTSELLLSPYAARAPQTIGVVVGHTADALLIRRIDAAFAISGIPHDEVGRATRGGARLVHVNGRAIDGLRSAYPFFRSAVIPAGTYANQPEAVETLSIDIGAAHAQEPGRWPRAAPHRRTL